MLTIIVNGHPNTQIDDLLPWAYAPKRDAVTVAREHRLRPILDGIEMVHMMRKRQARFAFNPNPVIGRAVRHPCRRIARPAISSCFGSTKICDRTTEPLSLLMTWIMPLITLRSSTGGLPVYRSAAMAQTAQIVVRSARSPDSSTLLSEAVNQSHPLSETLGRRIGVSFCACTANLKIVSNLRECRVTCCSATSHRSQLRGQSH